MVTKATKVDLKNWTVVTVYVYLRKLDMLFREFIMYYFTNSWFGDQFRRFHISQLFLQKLSTMGLFDVVLQWSCGLTGERA